MTTQHVTATYTPSMTKQWAIFRLEGLEIDLHGRTMENLAGGNVAIYEVGPHHDLWLSTASGNSERFVELFGRQAYRHLVALEQGHEKPVGSLDGLQRCLQRGLETRQQHLQRRNHMPLMA